MFVYKVQNGNVSPGRGGISTFHLAREVAWCWLGESIKPSHSHSKNRNILLNDPAWCVWALRNHRSTPKQTGFFIRLLQGGKKSGRLDFSARVMDSLHSGLSIKLSSRDRFVLDRIGEKSRQLTRLVNQLDVELFNICCTLVATPALVFGFQKKQSLTCTIPNWGYPAWVRQLTEAFYLGSPAKGWCQSRKMIWHGLRLVFGTTKCLPKTIPPFTRKDLEKSCAFLGIPFGKMRISIRRNSKRDASQVFGGRCGRAEMDHLKIALKVWVSQSTGQEKGKKSDLGKADSFSDQKKQFVATNNRVDLEKVRSEIIAELAGGAGHEINNPLAILIGRAQSILKEEAFFFRNQGREEGVRRLASIVEQGRRIHVMIRKLARIGRPATGHPIPFILKGELDSWLQPWREKASSQGVQLTCSYLGVGTEQLWVLADPAYLKETLDELLDNAFVQVSVGHRVDVGVGRKGASCLVDVSNDGPAIAPEVSSLIFNPFYSNRKAGRFSGLGLPLAKSLMEASGGKITLHSIGETTPVCFRIQIPILVDKSEANKPDSKSSSKAA